ncbi:MAG: thioredoxin [Candidatus Krumholzibacteriota bacterium]|nr:thioredoxin [Candidatus Krumholzibacteriota bacterium]
MSGKIKEIVDGNFNSVIKESRQPVVVDFWAPWCVPCKQIEKIIEEMVEKYEGAISFCKINVSDNNETTKKYEVRNIPLLLFFENGKLIDRITGSISKELIEEKLRKLVKLV